MTINAIQSTYTARPGIAYAGMVADMVQGNTITRLCEEVTGMGFGLAVRQGVSDKGSLLGGPVAKFLGVTIRDITLIHLASADVDKYVYRENVGVRTSGQIYVSNAGANVAAGDPVFYNPTSGAFSGAAGAATVGAPVRAGTGNGVMTLAGTPYGPGIVEGTYRATVIQAAANGGVFQIFDPAGNEVGVNVVGAPYVGPVRFTIADGATDFVVGDEFTIPVTMAAEGPIPGARWVDSALSGALARINFGIQQ